MIHNWPEPLWISGMKRSAPSRKKEALPRLVKITKTCGAQCGKVEFNPLKFGRQGLIVLYCSMGIKVVDCPTRWSLILIFGFLCRSSISIPKCPRNIVQQYASIKGATAITWCKTVDSSQGWQDGMMLKQDSAIGETNSGNQLIYADFTLALPRLLHPWWIWSPVALNHTPVPCDSEKTTELH